MNTLKKGMNSVYLLSGCVNLRCGEAVADRRNSNGRGRAPHVHHRHTHTRTHTDTHTHTRTENLLRHNPSIYTRARREAASQDRTGARDEERLHGQVLLHMLGGRRGQATGGFCSKSDRLTSPSPLHEGDIELE